LRKRNAEGSTNSTGSNSTVPTAEDWQKSKAVLLESVQIEEAILRSRMDQLDELEKLCQTIQSGIDQQQREEQIVITVYCYQKNKSFNVTMNSVEDSVLALKLAIGNHTNHKSDERMRLVSQTSLIVACHLNLWDQTTCCWARYHFFSLS
jgi:hypothetical protein